MNNVVNRLYGLNSKARAAWSSKSVRLFKWLILLRYVLFRTGTWTIPSQERFSW